MNPLILGSVLDVGKSLLDRFFPNEEERRRVEAQFLQDAMKGELSQIIAQLEINAKEAQHPSIFVAGWRPAVGWVCVAALAFQYLARPLLIGFGIVSAEMPGLDDELWAILVGILGIGGLRTFEKHQKLTK